jgi:hypothetical protein
MFEYILREYAEAYLFCNIILNTKMNDVSFKAKNEHLSIFVGYVHEHSFNI